MQTGGATNGGIYNTDKSQAKGVPPTMSTVISVMSLADTDTTQETAEAIEDAWAEVDSPKTEKAWKGSPIYYMFISIHSQLGGGGVPCLI